MPHPTTVPLIPPIPAGPAPLRRAPAQLPAIVSKTASITYHSRVLDPLGMTPADIDAWADLEARALEANAYHSPHFVLPALRHLEQPGTQAKLVLIERAGLGSRALVGAAVVRRVQGSRVMPLPHLEVYCSEYSCLGAPLVDWHHALEVTAELIRAIRPLAAVGTGIVVRKLDGEGELIEILQAVLNGRQRSIGLIGSQPRAMLFPAEAGPDSLKSWPRKKINDLERCRRRLAEQGNLQWQVHRDALPEDSVEHFLRLEHMGWKGEEGSSLRSVPAREAFFREMSQGFARRGRALFTELRLDGIPIASTSNVVSGGAGFAFKVGWDPDYRKQSVGILNEIELIKQAPIVCKDLDYIDSGSTTDSFINDIWPDSRPLVSAFVPTTPLGAAAWRAFDALRRARTLSSSARPQASPVATATGAGAVPG